MKSTYIWGAGHYGVLTALDCEQKDIKIAGFIDSNAKIKTKLGLPVLPSTEIISKKVVGLHILIAVRNETIIKEITEILLMAGLKDKDFKVSPLIILEIEKEKTIRNFFLSLNPSEQEQDVQEIISYFEENYFSIFPYFFTKKYDSLNIDVFYDKTCDMSYVLHKNKKMFFPKEVNCLPYYKSLCLEQDEDSPHRYETRNFIVKNGDVIADIGAAEGIWALTYADIAKKIYLFESDKKWIQALKKTFEPWKEKTIIVDKYVSNINEDKSVTLDDYFQNETLNFIKADIEGMEVKLLEGATKTLTRENDLKLLLCAYHKKGDAEEFKKRLDELGFITEYSKKYMLYTGDKDLEEPYIRRGLVRAAKPVL
ncbi:MAG: FkbM family methyltransferase [Fibromonadaceae bacterium]|jgi:hypothetical protein|nr:FkbM family methyltransferase [Fibromonadaceae bacterium]